MSLGRCSSLQGWRALALAGFIVFRHPSTGGEIPLVGSPLSEYHYTLCLWLFQSSDTIMCLAATLLVLPNLMAWFHLAFPWLQLRDSGWALPLWQQTLLPRAGRFQCSNLGDSL